jgi:hypothetical protein
MDGDCHPLQSTLMRVGGDGDWRTSRTRLNTTCVSPVINRRLRDGSQQRNGGRTKLSRRLRLEWKHKPGDPWRFTNCLRTGDFSCKFSLSPVFSLTELSVIGNSSVAQNVTRRTTIWEGTADSVLRAERVRRKDKGFGFRCHNLEFRPLLTHSIAVRTLLSTAENVWFWGNSSKTVKILMGLFVVTPIADASEKGD